MREGRSGIGIQPERTEYGYRSPLTGIVEKPQLKGKLDRKLRMYLAEEGEYAYMATCEAFEQAGIDDAYLLANEVGVLFGKLMYIFTGGKVNPLIGSAGVSAVPMAARVSQKVGQETNPSNYLLMHALGPNVAGVIGSAVAAGVLLAVLGR